MNGRAASYLIVGHPKIAKSSALISVLIGLCLEIFLSFRDGRLILMAGMAITGTVLPNTQMAFSDGKKDIFKMQYPAMSSNVFDIYMAGMAITGTVLPNTQMAFSDGNKDIS